MHSGLEQLRALTEQLHQKDRELKHNAELFKKLLDAAPDAMLVLNSNGQIIIANKRAEKLFQYTRNELIGNFIEMLVPDKYADNHAILRTNYISNPENRRMGILQCPGKKKDGTEVILEISLSPVEFRGDILVSSVIRDLSECMRN